MILYHPDGNIQIEFDFCSEYLRRLKNQGKDVRVSDGLVEIDSILPAEGKTRAEGYEYRPCTIKFDRYFICDYTIFICVYDWLENS